MSPRQIAKLAGDKYYKGGSPCAIHGNVDRQTSNGTCRLCQAERCREWAYSVGNQDYPTAYFQGRKYRSADRPNKPPYSIGTVKYYWWMAGWNDRDIELELKDKR